jgi:hypothetical protein
MALFKTTLTSAASEILAAPVTPLPTPATLLGGDDILAASRLLDPGHDVHVERSLSETGGTATRVAAAVADPAGVYVRPRGGSVRTPLGAGHAPPAAPPVSA